MTILTGDNIYTAQLIIVKHAIKLEALGMKHSGGSVRARWAKKLGLSPRAKHEIFVQKLNQLIQESK